MQSLCARLKCGEENLVSEFLCAFFNFRRILGDSRKRGNPVSVLNAYTWVRQENKLADETLKENGQAYRPTTEHTCTHHAHKHTCTHTLAHTHVHTHTHTHTHTRAHTRAYVHTHIRTYVRTYVPHTNVRTYVHTRT